MDKIRSFLWKVASSLVAIVVILLCVGVISVSDFSEIIGLQLNGGYTEEEIHKAENEAYSNGYNAGLQASSGNSTTYDYSQYEQPDEYANRTAWVTETGGSFHIDRNCSHIKNRYVSETTVGAAASDGKDPCKDCSSEVWNYFN